MALTEKQRRFCNEYLIDANATQAAIRAGYSPKTANEQASRLLAKVNVQEELQRLTEQVDSEKIASAQEIMEYLTSVVRGTAVSEEIVVEATGSGYSEARPVDKHPSEKDRLKAAELLGKRYGLYTERIDANITTPVVIMGYDDIKA